MTDEDYKIYMTDEDYKLMQDLHDKFWFSIKNHKMNHKMEYKISPRMVHMLISMISATLIRTLIVDHQMKDSDMERYINDLANTIYNLTRQDLFEAIVKQ
jgi:hypothetical protein